MDIWLFIIWVVGNLVLPAMPVGLVWGMRKLSRKPATLHNVLRDGILFFYIATLAAILTMDAAKVLMTGVSSPSPGVAVVALVICVLIMIAASGAYLVVALIHSGALDREGDTFDLDEVGKVSWRLALVAAIFCAGFRLWSGMY